MHEIIELFCDRTITYDMYLIHVFNDYVLWYSNVPRGSPFFFFSLFKENAGNMIELISLSVPLLASLNT